MSTQRYWVFSNKPRGYYGEDSIWDTYRILRSKRWYFGKSDKNALRIRAGDYVIARIFKQGYIASFRCAGPWRLDKRWSSKRDHNGYVLMAGPILFGPPLPQKLVIDELSNRNVRNKIIEIGKEDFEKISFAQRIYKKLGGPSCTGESLFILEKGLEEAVKHNLKGLGLSLAEKKIAQQFRMSIGRSDLICRDDKGHLWVLELKREDQPSLEVVGQVFKYMGWVRENLCKRGQQVYGMIICGGADQDLVYACREANIELRVFRIPW